jgi:hypothetical protein
MMLPRLEKVTEFMKPSSRRLSQGMETSRGRKGRSQSDEMVPAEVVVLLVEDRDLCQKREEPLGEHDGACLGPAIAVAVAVALAVALAVVPGAAAAVDVVVPVGVLESLEVLEAGVEEPRHRGCIGVLSICDRLFLPRRCPDRKLRLLTNLRGEVEKEERGEDEVEGGGGAGG